MKNCVYVHAGLASGVIGRGLQCVFRVEGAKKDVILTIDAGNIIVEASSGKWNKDRTTLRLSPKDASEFTVTLLPKD